MFEGNKFEELILLRNYSTRRLLVQLRDEKKKQFSIKNNIIALAAT